MRKKPYEFLIKASAFIMLVLILDVSFARSQSPAITPNYEVGRGGSIPWNPAWGVGIGAGKKQTCVDALRFCQIAENLNDYGTCPSSDTCPNPLDVPCDRMTLGWFNPCYKIDKPHITGDPDDIIFYAQKGDEKSFCERVVYDYANIESMCGDKPYGPIAGAAFCLPLRTLMGMTMNSEDAFCKIVDNYEQEIDFTQCESAIRDRNIFEYCVFVQNATRDVFLECREDDFEGVPNEMRNSRKELPTCTWRNMDPGLRGPENMLECRHWAPLYRYIFNRYNKFDASCKLVFNSDMSHVTCSVMHPHSNTEIVVDPYNLPGQLGVCDFSPPIKIQKTFIPFGGSFTPNCTSHCNPEVPLSELNEETLNIYKERAMNLVTQPLECGGYEIIAPYGEFNRSRRSLRAPAIH